MKVDLEDNDTKLSLLLGIIKPTPNCLFKPNISLIKFQNDQPFLDLSPNNIVKNLPSDFDFNFSSLPKKEGGETK